MKLSWYSFLGRQNGRHFNNNKKNNNSTKKFSEKILKRQERIFIKKSISDENLGKQLRFRMSSEDSLLRNGSVIKLV